MYVCLSTLEFVMSQNGWHKDDGKPVGKKPRILDVAIALQWYYCRYLWWAGVGQNTSLHYHHWHHHQRPPLLMSKRFLQKKTKTVSDVDKQIHIIGSLTDWYLLFLGQFNTNLGCLDSFHEWQQLLFLWIVLWWKNRYRLETFVCDKQFVNISSWKVSLTNLLDCKISVSLSQHLFGHPAKSQKKNKIFCGVQCL